MTHFPGAFFDILEVFYIPLVEDFEEEILHQFLDSAKKTRIFAKVLQISEFIL